MENFMSNTFAIELNKETFKKSCKRLNKELSQYLESTPEIPLSIVQEMQAKAFGFRNTDALFKFFDKNKSIDIPTKHNAPIFLQDWSKEHILKVFAMLLEYQISDSMWRQRAIGLISTVIEVVDYQRFQDGTVITVEEIRKHMHLDILCKILRNSEEYSDSVVNKVKGYLIDVPGFQISAPKQGETVVEQHGFNQMHINSLLEKLEYVQNHDVLIVSLDWLQAVSHHTNEHGEVSDTKIVSRIDAQYLQELYAHFPPRQWIDFNIDHVPYHLRYIDNGKNYAFKGFEIIDAINHHEDSSNSWLKDELFGSIAAELVANKQLRNYTFSELLLYTCKIVNQKKRSKHIALLVNLLDYYSTVIEYSNKFNELAANNK